MEVTTDVWIIFNFSEIGNKSYQVYSLYIRLFCSYSGACQMKIALWVLKSFIVYSFIELDTINSVEYSIVKLLLCTYSRQITWILKSLHSHDGCTSWNSSTSIFRTKSVYIRINNADRQGWFEKVTTKVTFQAGTPLIDAFYELLMIFLWKLCASSVSSSGYPP